MISHVIPYSSSVQEPLGTLGPVLTASPGFRHRYLALVEAADGDPGSAVVMTELADYVAGLADRLGQLGPELARCLAAVEAMATRSDDDAEVVAWAFVDSLSPDDRARLRSWFGPRTRALVAEVEADDADDR